MTGKGTKVTDALIRGVPEDDLARVDRAAERAGVSRAEYLRRLIARCAEPSTAPVTRADLDRFLEATRDLGDPAIMADAW
jgi:hypothetical protein